MNQPSNKKKILVITEDKSLKEKLLQKGQNYLNISFINENSIQFNSDIDVYLIPESTFMKNKENAQFPWEQTLVYGNGSILPLVLLSDCIDYIKEPFSVEELFYRIERHQLFLIHIDANLNIKFQSGQLFINQQPINLSGKESILLKTLLKNPNSVVSRETIEIMIWKNLKHNSRRVDMIVSQLRKKIQKHLPVQTSVNSILKSEYGLGYRVILPKC